jgi:hypothetical protein
MYLVRSTNNGWPDCVYSYNYKSTREGDRALFQLFTRLSTSAASFFFFFLLSLLICNERKGCVTITIFKGLFII